MAETSFKPLSFINILSEGLAIADDARDEEPGIVECGSERRRQGVGQFTVLMIGAGHSVIEITQRLLGFAFPWTNGLPGGFPKPAAAPSRDLRFRQRRTSGEGHDSESRRGLRVLQG